MVVLALYGDLIKRVVPATVALGALYAAALVILFAMLRGGRAQQHPPLASNLAGWLIAVYFVQVLTIFTGNLLYGVMLALYVSIPLSFLYLIPRTYPQFDLYALSLYTTILMVPIHAVGLVQRFIESVLHDFDGL